ncbi:hypothetical protein [Methanotorris igneus]|nr:hypothetical protein [Methanotorris igneus]
MHAKEMASKVLQDIYKNLDEYCKDLIRTDLVDVEFKGFYMRTLDKEKIFIRDLEDYEHLPDVEVENRKYKLKRVNLKHVDDGLMIIHLSSRKAKEYEFEVDSAYEVVYPTSDVTYEHRERILKWMELDDEDLDKLISEFDARVEDLLSGILVNSKIKKEVLVYVDVFMDLEKIKNYIESDEERIILWLHPMYLFSGDEVLKGIITYELSRYDKNLLEIYYKDVIEYCKEYKKLCNKNLKVLEKIKNIAIERNDTKSIEIIKEIQE